MTSLKLSYRRAVPAALLLELIVGAPREANRACSASRRQSASFSSSKPWGPSIPPPAP